MMGDNRPLAKVFFATESAEKMSFKSLISNVSVRSVAVLNSLMQEVKYDAFTAFIQTASGGGTFI